MRTVTEVIIAVAFVSPAPLRPPAMMNWEVWNGCINAMKSIICAPVSIIVISLLYNATISPPKKIKISIKMIADTKNIEYGIYYRSAEKYVRFFMDEYRRAVEAL